MKIVVIPLNNFPMTRQNDWENYCMPLCSNVIRVCDELISNGDDKLYICPIYAQGSRTLAYNTVLIDTQSNVNEINDMQQVQMDDNVHMLYVKDDSNLDYRESLAACVANLIS